MGSLSEEMEGGTGGLFWGSVKSQSSVSQAGSGMRARTGGSPGGVKTQFEKSGRATETTETPSPG